MISTKFQMANSKQIPMTLIKILNGITLVIGYWGVEFIWRLEFEICDFG